jgi:hypothetical protein
MPFPALVRACPAIGDYSTTVTTADLVRLVATLTDIGAELPPGSLCYWHDDLGDGNYHVKIGANPAAVQLTADQLAAEGYLSAWRQPKYTVPLSTDHFRP